MAGRVHGLIPITTSTITTKTFSTIVKARVDSILRPKFTSFIITITFVSFITTKFFVNRTRNYIQTQQSTTTTWIMGGRVAAMIPIYTYPITINNLSTIVKVRVAGLLRPKSKSYVVTIYITPLITTNTFVKRTWSNRATRQSNTLTWVMGERVDGIITI